ncbi:hypothetical protein GEMRC1_002465 [Eukaryota sp. GEM-RC1]
MSQSFAYSKEAFCKALSTSRERNFLIDCSTSFHSNSFPSHSFVLTFFSDHLQKELKKSPELLEHPSLEPILPDHKLLFSVLSTFYGSSLSVTQDNFHLLMVIASQLQFKELSSFVTNLFQKGYQRDSNHSFALDPNQILKKFIEKSPRDIVLVYSDCKVSVNSLLLVSFSNHFKEIFTNKWIESNDRKFQYSDEFPGVTKEEFEIFFSLFTCTRLDFGVKNSISFFQLSFYFQVDVVRKAVLEYLKRSKFSSDDLVFLIDCANTRNNLLFLQENIDIFKNLPSTITQKPLPLFLSVINLLITVIDQWWLVDCLALTHQSKSIDEEFLTTTLGLIKVEASQYLTLFEKAKTLLLDSLYDQFTLPWSLNLFSTTTSPSKIPLDWYLWTLTKVDQYYSQFHQNLSLLSSCFMDVVSHHSSSSLSPISLSPSSFLSLSSGVKGEFCIWLALCLISSWKCSTEWSFESFSACFEALDLSETNPVEMLEAVKELKTNSKLKEFYFKFNSEFIVPEMLKKLIGLESKVKDMETRVTGMEKREKEKEVVIRKLEQREKEKRSCD